jgi:hypothetical protein
MLVVVSNCCVTGSDYLTELVRYTTAPEYYFTELGKAVLSKLKMTKETGKRNE